MKFEWENIDVSRGSTYEDSTCRALVVGGWLVRYEGIFYNTEFDPHTSNSSMIFIPDANHGWVIDDK